MIPYIVLGIILFVLIALLIIPIGIGAKYENGAFVIIKVAFFKVDIPINRIIGKKKKKRKPKPEEKEKNELEKGIIGLDFILSLLGDFRRFVRKRFHLSDFDFHIIFGTGEAASTAVLSGHIWALSYNLLGLIDKIFYVDNPKVNVTPVFNDAQLKVSAMGIIKTRLAHIIATAVVFVYKLIKYKNTRRKTK